MTAQEIRGYRSMSKKLVQIEERAKLLEQLKKRQICLGEEEVFVQNLIKKFKVLGDKTEMKTNCHNDIASIALKYKIRDNSLQCTKVRKKRNWLRGRVETVLGSRSSTCRNLIEEVKQYTTKYRKKLKLKNQKKVEHLSKKYGVKKKISVDNELLEIMGKPKLFYDDKVEVDDIRKPVIVEGVGEHITLTVDEEEALKLGPKFCLYVDLKMEDFETDLEESIVKVKWDFMATDKAEKAENRNKTRGLEDVALEILLGEEVCNRIDEENDEENEMNEALLKTPFNRKEMTFNLARRKATDLKCNSRVTLPRKPRCLEEESALETLRMELKSLFSYYVSNNCGKGGKQVSNLSKSQKNGLLSIRKRVKDGEIVIIPTDKSGNLAIMTRDSYLKAGLKHTIKDREVGWDQLKEPQKELNGHVSMIIKFFKMGAYWEHGSRIRETTMGEGLSTCPLSLLFKDHKGWSSDSGTVPPTRPVVGGHLGINMPISEIVSDILDPVVSTYSGGREIISTEDLLARLEIVNEGNSGWSPTSYWKGMHTMEYRACDTCTGDMCYEWDEDKPDTCDCNDGIDDDGRMMVTQNFMRMVRRKEWEKSNGWVDGDLDRLWDGNEVLSEDLQDVSKPMIIIGTDVINLYPSLNIREVVKNVKEAILESNITWQEIDYLEGARYVALNWPESKCRSSGLRRVLPTRRYTTGSRPGLKGVGP